MVDGNFEMQRNATANARYIISFLYSILLLSDYLDVTCIVLYLINKISQRILNLKQNLTASIRPGGAIRESYLQVYIAIHKKEINKTILLF